MTAKKPTPENTPEVAQAAEPKPSIRYAELPLVSVLNKRQIQQAVELFDELEGLEYVFCPDAGKMVKQEARVKTIKSQLMLLQAEGGLDGFRHGQRAFSSSTLPGRKTVDTDRLKVALVQAGVGVDVVAACFEECTKEGKPYAVSTFKLLNGE